MDDRLGPLGRKIAAQIHATGPMRVSDYMARCLLDPDHGYYTRQPVFGAAGDFTTAPEISQIFGELIGLWCADAWQRMGKPSPLALIEYGPGRGTLMRDALRAAAVIPGFHNALQVHLIEASPELARRQRETLRDAGMTIGWPEGLCDVPPGPSIVVANEFLDALPIRQLVRGPAGWHERLVELDDAGKLAFGQDTLAVRPEDLGLKSPPTPQPGDILEWRPGLDQWMDDLVARAKAASTYVLIIDYGHQASAPGDTLQAVRAHQYADPLEAPGHADLTAHVDFAALERVATSRGLTISGPMTQGSFLIALGLRHRLERLLAVADPEQARLLSTGAARLVEPEAMGALFKVLVLRSPHLPLPEPFASQRPGGT